MKKKQFTDWWKQDKRYLTLLKAVLMALLPVVCCLVRTAAEGRSIGQVYLPASEWNDELFYFKQVESIVKYGFPRGYFGFNESHALQLSFAAWSPVLVFPWILWGLVFGWNLLSPVICNIVLLTIAMFVFVWLVKPTWKQLGILTVLFSLYTLFTRYMLSGMPEVICFGMLILFYGLAFSYLKKETKGKLTTMFIVSVLLTLMRPYMLLFLLLACYFLIRRSRKSGWIVSALVVAATGVVYVLIKHYLGAEYFTPLFYTDWITTFFTDGIGAGFRNFFGTLHWKGLEFYRHCVSGAKSGLASGAFFDGYLLLLAILLVQSYLDIRKLRRAKKAARIVMEPADDKVREAILGPVMLTEEKRKDLQNRLIIELHFAFSLIAMLFAHLLMYKMVEGSKHFLTFIAAGIFIVSMLETKYYKKAVLLGAAFLYLYSYKAVEPYDYQIPYITQDREAQVDYWQQIFAEHLTLETEKVPNYENVVIWTFGDETPQGNQNLKWQLLYGVPEGFGISCCEREYILEHLTELRSRYLATVSGGEIDELCSVEGYEEIGRDADMVLYRRY
ncbi:MAG: hypothetical protein EGR48_07900 [Lachnospiraceae bacterium]|nr:hypothetical protein [Lachnospiraceae bacterium]